MPQMKAMKKKMIPMPERKAVFQRTAQPVNYTRAKSNKLKATLRNRSKA